MNLKITFWAISLNNLLICFPPIISSTVLGAGRKKENKISFHPISSVGTHPSLCLSKCKWSLLILPHFRLLHGMSFSWPVALTLLLCAFAPSFLLHSCYRYLSLVVICDLFPFGSSLLLHWIGITWNFFGDIVFSLSSVCDFHVHCLQEIFSNEHLLLFLTCSFPCLAGAHCEYLQN